MKYDMRKKYKIIFVNGWIPLFFQGYRVAKQFLVEAYFNMDIDIDEQRKQSKRSPAYIV